MRPALRRRAVIAVLIAISCFRLDTVAATARNDDLTLTSDSSENSEQSSTSSYYDASGSQENCESRIFERDVPPPKWANGARTSALEVARALAERGARADTVFAGSLARGLLQKHASRGPKATVLAVALAAPQTRLALLMFRAGSQQMEANSSSASRYWRELGAAWNRSAVGMMGGAAGQWGRPFLDCGPLPGRWVMPYSVAAATRLFKVVAGVFVSADLDQCDELSQEMFGGLHKCDKSTTECVPELTWGPQRGRYTCECRAGYYSPDGTNSIPGYVVERNSFAEHSCLPCSGNCDRCDSSGQCLAEGEPLIRACILTIQSLCLFAVFVLAIIVFRNRKCKTIASGMWRVLETLLLGIFLLYTSVLIRLLPVTSVRCLVEPWCRELGFVVCYGAVVLKLYRHLIEFRTRKAHRWVIRDTDLLKYLAAMVVAVLCYLAAFTAFSLDYLEHHSIVESRTTIAGLKFSTCKPLRWDFVTQAGEMFILAFGIHLAFASRNAATQYKERQFLCAIICVEVVISGSFYFIRDVYLELVHPDYAFLAYFLRSQLTCTIVLLLIFVPKLWFQLKQEYSLKTPEITNTVVSCCDGELTEINLADMSIDDIRTELKRLYTELELLKSKTLRADNPHISKRKGGRKVAHRRFSLQKLELDEKTNLESSDLIPLYNISQDDLNFEKFKDNLKKGILPTVYTPLEICSRVCMGVSLRTVSLLKEFQCH